LPTLSEQKVFQLLQAGLNYKDRGEYLSNFYKEWKQDYQKHFLSIAYKSNRYKKSFYEIDQYFCFLVEFGE